MENLPHLTWLRSFEAAARLNSFSAAAPELHLTPAAVSQQIRLLENHLGVVLFERLPRGVALTDIGQAYAIPIRKSFADISDITRGLFRPRQKQTLYVRAPVSFANLVLIPRLSEFHNQHPDIVIQVSTAVWADRFDEESLDIDIRYGHGNWPEDEIIHLRSETALIICHEDYATSFGNYLSPQALADAKVAQIIGSELDWMMLSELHDLGLKVPEDWFKADSSLSALQMVLSGEGSVIVLESFAKWYLERGLLISPFSYRLPIQRSHFAIPRTGTAKRADVKIFCQWLQSLPG